MEKRYRVLRFISGFYKILGIIVGVLAILSGLGICVTSVLGTSLLTTLGQNLQNSGMPLALGAGGVVAGIISALFAILAGAISALGLYAVGELISLLISMEENTRAAAAFMQYRQPAQAPQAPPPPVMPVQ
jgi:hypothetical protein